MPERQPILVHACCAACAGYVLTHLAELYDVTAYFYNPNIQPESEYAMRLEEMRRVSERLRIRLIEGDYRTLRWWKEIWTFRHLPEKSERCWTCYRHRLEVTARKAAELGIPMYTSTLSVSPHKIFQRIAAIGASAGKSYGVSFLAEDFKKKDGFRRSVERAGEHGVTRQNYCGCLMSLEESRTRRTGPGG